MKIVSFRISLGKIIFDDVFRRFTVLVRFGLAVEQRENKCNKYGESPKYVVERDFSERNPERNNFQGRDFEEIKL